MKMKVEVSRLKAAIRKHIAQDQRRFERESEKYKEAYARARERHIDLLVKYIKEVRSGGEMLDGYDLRQRLEHACSKYPVKPKDPEMHTALLIKLDLAEDQILTVDDHSDYMKFLDGKCVCR